MKAARITYGYSLNSDNQYHQFPELIIPFDLQFGQFVQIRYNVQIYTPTKCWFICRVVVDGVERFDFRTLTGYTEHHSNHISDELWLDKGHHTVYLQYRMNGVKYAYSVHQDWDIAVLKVFYYEK